MENIYAALIEHRHNLSPKLLEEGEELLIGWGEEIRANLVLRRLSTVGRAQEMAELSECTEMMGKLRVIFAELWEGVHDNTRCEDLKRRCYGGLEERQVLCDTMSDRLYEVDDVGTSVISVDKEVAICCTELEERQGSRGGLGGLLVCSDDNKFNNSISIDVGHNGVHGASRGEIGDNGSDNDNINNNEDLAVVVLRGANINDDNFFVHDDGMWALGEGNDCNITSDINNPAGDNMTGNTDECNGYHCNDSIDNDKTVGDHKHDNDQDSRQALSPSFHLSFFASWSILRNDQGLRRQGWVIRLFGEQEDCMGMWEAGWWRVGVG
ncbi:hypothetical protein CBR_g22904 [Chara braunii]|uniref:Uncharacterized protein n=1 Tax=Chara braunii TaxID=69332 RepID=A0A388L313_CHABU|nr:hypothetical protein CBR_g22904 [Chara braunii]|eukprot:GBG76686.1 hypothetical protein CBR_g22904 [Chara braunii]